VVTARTRPALRPATTARGARRSRICTASAVAASDLRRAACRVGRRPHASGPRCSAETQRRRSHGYPDNSVQVREDCWQSTRVIDNCCWRTAAQPRPRSTAWRRARGSRSTTSLPPPPYATRAVRMPFDRSTPCTSRLVTDLAGAQAGRTIRRPSLGKGVCGVVDAHALVERGWLAAWSWARTTTRGGAHRRRAGRGQPTCARSGGTAVPGRRALLVRQRCAGRAWFEEERNAGRGSRWSSDRALADTHRRRSARSGFLIRRRPAPPSRHRGVRGGDRRGAALGGRRRAAASGPVRASRIAQRAARPVR
jgi:hypothetical protein